MRPIPQVLTCVVAMAFTGVLSASEAVYRQALKSTVAVVAGKSCGSGVVVNIEDRLVVTSFHVVGEEQTALVFFPVYEKEQLVTERGYYTARLKQIGIAGRVTVKDPRRDTAVIQLDSLPEGASAIRLADASPTPGEQIHSIGNPGASQALWVYTSGTVRQVYCGTAFGSESCLFDARVIETQSPVNPGDSGGPVVNDRGELVGIVRSFQRDARLVSHCVDVSEVGALLSGDVKSIDRRVREALEAKGVKYEVNVFGVFRIPLQFSKDDQCLTIIVPSETGRYCNLEMREVVAAVCATDRPLSANLANRLLTLNSTYKFGAWSVAKVRDKHFIMFTAKLDANAQAASLHATIQGVLDVARAERSRIAQLVAADGIDPASLIGRWQGTVETPDGKKLGLQLEFRQDGTFTLDDTACMLRGTYALDDGVIKASVGGEEVQLGVVQAIEKNRLVLLLRRGRSTLVRQQENCDTRNVPHASASENGRGNGAPVACSKKAPS